MKYDLITDEINKIQVQYKALLIKLLPILNTEDILIALDEINLFWYSNIEIVTLFLKYGISGNNTYIFTASTYLDIDDQEHLPFLLLGDIHIFDDPLSKYALSVVNQAARTTGIIEQIKLTAEDNIKIITECENQILVLPLRLLNQLEENTLLTEVAEQYFCSLFDGIETISDYITNCNSFSDIDKYMKETAKRYILFSNQDDSSLPFDQRYSLAKKSMSIKLVDNDSDGKIFFALVYGPIQQAIDILMSSIEYECIPFIRYKVALHYILMLCKTFEGLIGIEFIKVMKFKICVANLVYNMFDKEQLLSVSISKYVEIVQREKFEIALFKDLYDNGIVSKRFKLQSMECVIAKNLSNLYIKLK